MESRENMEIALKANCFDVTIFIQYPRPAANDIGNHKESSENKQDIPVFQMSRTGQLLKPLHVINFYPLIKAQSPVKMRLYRLYAMIAIRQI
jgi:hypothetical protein